MNTRFTVTESNYSQYERAFEPVTHSPYRVGDTFIRCPSCNTPIRTDLMEGGLCPLCNARVEYFTPRRRKLLLALAALLLVVIFPVLRGVSFTVLWFWGWYTIIEKIIKVWREC